jgi:magnesium and cobalt transporter
MNDDSGSSQQDKSWFEKLTQAFSSDPETREELLDVIREAHNNQLIETEVLDIIEGALDVSEQQVRDIMVQRSHMVVIEADSRPETVLNQVIGSGHSRFPVVGESQDDIKGVLLAKELLPLVLKGIENFDLNAFIRPASIIPESKRLNVLLKEFREQRYHMAIVVDEYGSVSGLVTIEDVLEEIVGEIEDETDEAEIDNIRLNQNGTFTVEALTPIEEFNEHFDLTFSDDDYDTIGGIVMQAFGRLPEEGELIKIHNFGFKIVKGDNRQIYLLEVVTP